MRAPFTRIALGLLLLGLLAGCGGYRKAVPVGEVPQQHFVHSADEAYGHEVLNSLVQRFPLDNDDTRINRVRDMVERLSKAAGADQHPWHVYVLRDDSLKNAAATRGNFIFVWTGMMNVAQTDGELATVLAHEIGHVLANHPMPTPDEEAREMVSGAAGTIAGSVLSSQGVVGPLADLADLAVTEILKAALVNPEQQRKELEADQIGLFLMADAGYNPEEALAFWRRAETDRDLAGSDLVFLSSHPSSSERSKRLEALLPQAMTRYEEGRGRPSGRVSSARWEVSASRLSVREAPTRSSRRIAFVESGEDLDVIERKGEWLRIEHPEQGFVHSSGVRRSR